MNTCCMCGKEIESDKPEGLMKKLLDPKTGDLHYLCFEHSMDAWVEEQKVVEELKKNKV